MVEPIKILVKYVTDADLVLRFFCFFSRFEYSLKRSGFLKRGIKAEPDWDAYANVDLQRKWSLCVLSVDCIQVCKYISAYPA